MRRRGRCCAGDAVEEWEILDLLVALVNKSLVLYEEREGKARYRLLETMHQYAREKLMATGAAEQIRERHRDYFLALAEEAESHLMGADQARWLQHMEEEHENFRTGLDWSLQEAGSEKSLRLCGVLQRFWGTRGYFSEGRAWSVRALSQAGGHERTRERAKVLHGASRLAFHQGDYVSARAYAEESLAIRKAIGDRAGIAGSLNSLGGVSANLGDYDTARVYYEESLAIQREIGDRAGIAGSLNNLGNVADNMGDYASARAYYEKSLAIQREIGDRSGASGSLNNLGNVAKNQGDYASARAYLEESLAIIQEIGDRSEIAVLLNNLGILATNLGDYASARTYVQESLAIQREIGNRFGSAMALNSLGNVVYFQGDYTSARAYYEESLAIQREIGDRTGVAVSLNNLGVMAANRGDYASAWTYNEESLTIYGETGDRRGLAFSLETFAGLAFKEERLEQAAALWGAAEALREELGSPLSPNATEEYGRDVAEVRQALGEEAFLAAWAKGCAMSLEQAIAYAREAHASGGASSEEGA